MRIFSRNTFKRLCTAIGLGVLMAASPQVRAQVSGYGFTPSSGTYTSITGGTQLNSTIPDSWVSTAAIPLSPAFSFGGTSYTTAWVTSNGLVTLGGTAPSSTQYNGIANNSGSGIAICPFNADMIGSSATGAVPEIRFETVGAEHVFQWKDITRYNAGDKFSFQLRLNTTTGVITTVYGGGITVGTSTSYQPVIGIRTSATDYKNLKVTAAGTETWAAPLLGTTNSDNLRFTSTTPNPKFPSDGQTYTFTPITCFAPVNIAVSGMTSNTANISWSAPVGSTPVTYLWEVRTSGAAGSGATGLAASGATTAPTTSATATGLTLSTAYSVYVRATCGGTDSSAWTPATTFTLQLPCVAPTAQPTALVLTPASTTVGGAFTGASPAPGSYLVVRTTGTAPTTPVNGTTYATGAGLGGTIVANITSPTVTFNNTGLTGNTAYSYFIYAYNNTGCSGGPTYNTANPLTATTTTCPAVPGSPTTSVITTTGFTLGWTTSLGGGASPVTYTVDVATDAAFTSLVTGSPFTVTNPAVSQTITGLNSATTYYYRVRANGACNSAYTTVASVNTACNTLTAPYSQTFNTASTPACWTNTTTPEPWYFNQNGTTGSPNPDYGADGIVDHTGNSGYFAWVDGSGSGTATGITLTSPVIDKSTVVNPRLRFYVFSNNTNTTLNNLLKIEAYNGTAWVLLDSVKQNLGATWFEKIIPLTSLTNAITQFRFVVDEKSATEAFYNDILIDDIYVEATPTCTQPTAVSVTGVTTTTATINFTAAVPVPASGYQYEVRTSGTGGSGATGLAASGNIATGTGTTVNTGLAANTAYTVYVRSDCGSGSFSVWTTAVAFTTPCNAITALPFLETFETTSTTKSCWKVVNGNNDADQWNLSSTTVAGHSGTMEATLYTDFNAGNNSDWLISPAITLGANKQLRYWYRAQSAGEPNDYTVKISTTGNDTTNFTTTLMPLTSVNNTTWVENTISLGAYTGTVYIAFHVPAGGLDGYYLHIDDVNVENIPTCNPPTALTATGVNSTGVTLNWTAPVAGTPVNYKWEVRTGGAPGSGATGLAQTNTVNAPLTTATVLGLAPNTTYNAYVQSNCGGGDTSFWTSAVVTFTTPCTPSTLPFAENFATVPPACWTRALGYLTATPSALTTATTSWGLDQYLNNSANGSAARINLWTTGKRDWLISPTIDLGATPNNYVLEFNLGIVAYSSSTTVTAPVGTTLGADDTVAVVVSTDNGATWTSANALRVWTAANTPVSTTGSQRFYISMNGYSGQIKIGFFGSEGPTGVSSSTPGDNDIFIDSMRISQCTIPTVALGNDTILCGTGTSLTLNAGTGTSYAWSTGASTQTINVSTPGTYSVTVFNGSPGCAKSDTISVLTGVLPTVNLGPDTSVCGNVLSFQLNAGNPGSNYAWSSLAANLSGFATQIIDLGPTINAGNISNSGAPTNTAPVIATVTNASGCVGRDTVNVSVIFTARVGDFNMTGSDPAFDFTPVADSFVTTYAWTFGDGGTASTQAPSHTYNTNGSYTVTLMVGNQCGMTDTVTKPRSVTNDVKDVTADGTTISLYPNPTAADAVLTVDGSAKLRGYQVLNAAGAVVAQRTLEGGSTRATLNTGAFAPGIYTLRIQLDKGVVVRKLEVIK